MIIEVTIIPENSTRAAVDEFQLLAEKYKGCITNVRVDGESERKMEIRGEMLKEWGHDDGLLVEVPENGKCDECSAHGEVWFIEGDHQYGLCVDCLGKAYPDCEFKVVERDSLSVPDVSCDDCKKKGECGDERDDEKLSCFEPRGFERRGEGE